MKHIASLDTLAISKDAKNAKLSGIKIIDATIGMMFDEDQQLYTFECVQKAINNIDHTYAYHQSSGDPGFQEKWLFHYTKKTMQIPNQSITTVGGTGAIFLAVNTFLEENDIIIIQEPYWINFNTIFKNYNKKYDTFKIDTEDTCHTNLKEVINRHYDVSNKIMIVMNDPSHNPTGQTLNKRDWEHVLSIIKSFPNQDKFILLIDLAYIDFSSEAINIFDIFDTSMNDLLVLCAFSGSKSFSLYGARIGMLTCFTKSESKRNDFKTRSAQVIRGTYSLPSSFGEKIIVYILEHHYDMYLNELKTINIKIKRRAELFIKVLKKHHIPYFKYDSGFFISIKSKNPINDFMTLKENLIYVVPFEGGLRFSIASMTLEDIDMFENVLKEKPTIFSQ